MAQIFKGLLVVSLIGTFIGLTGCADDGIPVDNQTRDYSATFAPLPTESVYPLNNPFSVEKEALGEMLFWDPLLSGDQNVACASCHHPDFGWADGRQLSIGSDGIGLGLDRTGSQQTPLHSPTVINVAFTGITINPVTSTFISGGYFWDLRTDTLEEQASGPIHSQIEMVGFNIPEDQIMNEIVLRLQGIPEYVETFDAAFATENSSTEQDTDSFALINEENITKAIATFQRKIISANTRFDDFLRGNEAALSQAEIVGLNKFIDGGCARCHSGPMLSDNKIHPNDIIIGDRAVRTPTMRNLAFTPPYMHDGSHTTLRDAISAYEDRDDLQVTLDEGDFGDIETFLRTLDTPNFYKDIPQSVPSGLQVGGDIN